MSDPLATALDSYRRDLDALLAAHAKQLEHLQAELARRDVVVAEMRSALGRWAAGSYGLTEATPAELLAERDSARAEVERMRAVYEAAKAIVDLWRGVAAPFETVQSPALVARLTHLHLAVDAALAAEAKGGER